MNARQRAEDAFRQAAAAHAGGQYDRALALYSTALQQWPRHWGARAGLDSILEMARTAQPNATLIGLLVAAYGDPASDWDALGLPAAHQLRVGWPVAADGQHDLVALARNALLGPFLRKSINRDPGLEALLVGLRDQLCAELREPEPAPAALPLAAALAEQAWNNEYVWPAPDAAASAFLDALEAAPREGDTTAALLAYALHRPLSRLPDAAERAVERWPEPLRILVRRTIAEPAQERALAAGIEAISGIDDAVSSRVAAMYEENPYPRWVHLPRRPPVDIREAIASAYPHAKPAAAPKGPLAVLMPGGGTGRHPLSVATSYRNVQVSAVDLSRASLAYARRMARQLDVRNVAFAQGDILALPAWGRTFDHAECVGVLHHMADPAAGLRAVAAVLRPGAFLRIGLYGEAARAPVVEARRLIASHGIPPTVDGIRAFRAAVLAGDGEFAALGDLREWEDFYSTSLLRDLVFHEQEHRFTIPRLRAFLEGSGLAFLGFEFGAGVAQRRVADAPPLQAYHRRFPEEPAAADLARWEALESDRPDLFAGYAFWCQKQG